MATTIRFGGSPLAWPNAFHRQGPSGRSILAWNGWDYAFAREAGIGERIEDFMDVWWSRTNASLGEREYDLPVLMLQMYDAFGDNGLACSTLSTFVRERNDRVGTPGLRIALPGDWWGAVSEYGGRLPTYRGDWTDYWNFGCGSSAREVRVNRTSRGRLRAADAAGVALEALGGELDPARRTAAATRARAWDALHLFDEHPWGANNSIRAPYDGDTVSQWHHKADYAYTAYAYTARSLSTTLARNAVAELRRRIA